MGDEGKILTLIYEAVDEVNAMFAADSRLEKSPSTVLLGGSGTLNSLGLVSFIVAVEGAVERSLGVSLHLADEMATPDGPLATIGTLARFISNQTMTT